MQIVYLNHSGFLIQTEDKKAIVLDYFGDSSAHNGYLHSLFDKGYKFYLLSSHHHHDHFDRAILDFPVDNKTYILSDDILSTNTLGKDELADNIHFIGKGGVFDDGSVVIKACGSTDAGVSFVINVNDRCIFHAGDLNNWHWTDESSVAEIRAAGMYFKRELSYVAGVTDHFDAVMFPVDPRMGSNFGLGALQLVQRVKVDTFIPMHYWNLKDKAMDFGRKELAPYVKRFVTIEGCGQIINLD